MQDQLTIFNFSDRRLPYKYFVSAQGLRLKIILNAFALLVALCSQEVVADVWTSPYVIQQIQPLVEWNGGLIRVQPSTATNPAGCTASNYYDLTYDAGTQESRSAVVSALYTAFVTGKQVRLFIDDNQCSPAGSAIIRGAVIINPG